MEKRQNVFRNSRFLAKMTLKNVLNHFLAGHSARVGHPVIKWRRYEKGSEIEEKREREREKRVDTRRFGALTCKQTIFYESISIFVKDHYLVTFPLPFSPVFTLYSYAVSCISWLWRFIERRYNKRVIAAFKDMI